MLLLVILVAGCAGWPDNSYIEAATDADAAVLVPAITECIKALVPEHTQVALGVTHDASQITLQVWGFMRHWSVSAFDGRDLTFVVEPIEGGMLISVEYPPTGRCGQYFSRATGVLAPAGAMMVSQ